MTRIVKLAALAAFLLQLEAVYGGGNIRGFVSSNEGTRPNRVLKMNKKKHYSSDNSEASAYSWDEEGMPAMEDSADLPMPEIAMEDSADLPMPENSADSGDIPEENADSGDIPIVPGDRTPEPTNSPTSMPTSLPGNTGTPTAGSTPGSTTETPQTDTPTDKETQEPGAITIIPDTVVPSTEDPTEIVTAFPSTEGPTKVETAIPSTEEPTDRETAFPSTEEPTEIVTALPSTEEPTKVETAIPSTEEPTDKETAVPGTEEPTEIVTALPSTEEPTEVETANPSTDEPTDKETAVPSTEEPTEIETALPSTEEPTEVETMGPTEAEAGNPGTLTVNVTIVYFFEDGATMGPTSSVTTGETMAPPTDEGIESTLQPTMSGSGEDVSTMTPGPSIAESQTEAPSDGESDFPATIVDIIVNSPDHTILERAVIAANLTDALSSPFPDSVTAFAPTDAAFESLGTDTLNRLLLPEYFYHLRDLLTYHVLFGSAVLSSNLTEGNITMQNTEGVSVGLDPVTINDANVTVPDLVAENGVVHVIDKVLLPSSATENAVSAILGVDDFTILVDLVVAANLTDVLSGPGNFTIFAPTNAAFEALGEDMLESLQQPESIDLLTSILTYHVSGSVWTSDRLSDGQSLTMLEGSTLAVSVGADSGNVTINSDVDVTDGDYLVNNGVIHIIDSVLIPPENGSMRARRRLQEVSEPSEEELEILIGGTLNYFENLYSEAFPGNLVEFEATNVRTSTNNAFGGVFALQFEADLTFSDVPSEGLVSNITEGANVDKYVEFYVKLSGDFFANTDTVGISVETYPVEEDATQTDAPTAQGTTPVPTESTEAPTTAPVAATDAPVTPSPTAEATKDDTSAPTGAASVVVTEEPATAPPSEGSTDSPGEVVTHSPSMVGLTGSPTASPTESSATSSQEPNAGCQGITLSVIGNFTYVLDPSADLTEPTSEQVIALARFTLRGIGDILRNEYGDGIQGFSATIDETDTDLVENLYTLLFDATILFRPCAPPSDEVNTIFEDADYNAILSGFEPEGADNVFQYLTGDATYQGFTILS